MAMMKGFDFNPITNTLTLTTTCAKKAGKLGTPEYALMKKLRQDYPTLTVTVKEKAKPAAGLDYKRMAEIIKLCRNSEKRLAIFEKIKSLSKAQETPYLYVKNWFLDNYANYDAAPQFDDDGFLIIKTKAEMKEEMAAEPAAEKAEILAFAS